MTEETLFHEAMAKTNPQERAAFLEAACAGQPELRSAIEALLAASERPGSFLNKPAVARPADTVDHTPATEAPGSVIGPYKLLQQIGQGGFGVVYMAQQEMPVRRAVALKIIKAGMDTDQVIARFESERQALAMMDHPNIAKVLDAGATASGRPFFVMELVKGIQITEFCDKNHFSPETRLKLFIDVCHAIQHAHHKGIIHRDVKPSNVMVTLHDGVPVVKVIDFGVAKATAQKLTERTLFTAYGQMIGTPAYMSPEQAEMSGLDIDTRSDVYSLGVLLYELLTGTTPLEGERLREAGYAEMQRLIREEEPPRPSTRLSSLGDSATVLAGNRGLDVTRLVQLLADDLDWVVMKALDKNRNRRYATPGSFAEDIDRYLRREPILARPPSTAYKLKKLVERNRVAVLTASLVAAALLVGLSAATWQAVRATRAERSAITERDEKERARQAAETQRKEAETQRDRATSAEKVAREQAAIAQAVNDFVQKDLLSQTDVENQPGGAGVDAPRDADIKVRTVLDRAAKTIEGRFASQPRVEAAIRLTLAKAYRALGHNKEAQLHAERSVALRTAHLGADHTDTLNSKEALAWVYCEQSHFGVDISGADVLGRAEALFREVLEKRTATLGPEHLDTVTGTQNLGGIYVYEGKLDLAEPLLQEVARKRMARLGAHDLETLRSKYDLAWLYNCQGKLDLAEAMYIEIIKAFESKSGEDHPMVLNAKSELAAVFESQHKYAQAEPLLQDVLKKRIAVLGPTHTNTLASKVGLGRSYRIQRRFDLAVPVLEEAVAETKASHGEESPVTLVAIYQLAWAYFDCGKNELAWPLFEQVLATRKEKFPQSEDLILATMNNLADAYLAQKMPERAIPHYEESLAKRKEKYGSDDHKTLETMRHLADAYRDSGRPSDAVPLYQEAIRRGTAGQRPGDLAVSHAKAGLGETLLCLGKHAEAEPPLHEALAVREKEMPVGAWQVAVTRSALGEALASQKRYAEAEPLLVAGYEGLKVAPDIPLRWQHLRSEGLERLVRLYEAWGKPDEAAKWRKELEEAESSTQKPITP